jgi:hypothetical protein
LSRRHIRHAERGRADSHCKLPSVEQHRLASTQLIA